MSSFTESIVEEASLAWLRSLGWRAMHGPDIARAEAGAERLVGASGAVGRALICTRITNLLSYM